MSALPLIIYVLICSKFKDRIIVQAWCKYKPFAFFYKDPLVHNNWGDDLNYYFMGQVIGKKILIYPNSTISRLIALKRYSFIGSILHFPLKNVIICGSGIRSEQQKDAIEGIPNHINFVRGPLTYQSLIKNGIECPKKYGDPALILPLYYTPKKKTKRWKIGLIPHYRDFQNEIVQNNLLNQPEDILIIKMRGYTIWTDVIDDICSCDVVCSSSLHGIIVSEAYGIPNHWVYLSDYPCESKFKYLDFYYSIGKYDIQPSRIKNNEDLRSLWQYRLKWQRANYDCKAILSNLFLEFQQKNYI